MQLKLDIYILYKDNLYFLLPSDTESETFYVLGHLGLEFIFFAKCQKFTYISSSRKLQAMIAEFPPDRTSTSLAALFTETLDTSEDWLCCP